MFPMPSADLVLAHLCAKSLRTFVEEIWPIIEPGTPFKPGRHIDEICAKLEAVTRGEVKRLVVNMPPRHMKSLIISVAWPAWVWLTKPEERFLCASYSHGLALDDSVKCRDILRSQGGEEEEGSLFERVGYRGVLELLGQDWSMTGDQNEKEKFKNSRQGYRAATSVGGTVTGKGGGVVILDDPNSADDAHSEAARRRVKKWLGGTLASRLNDPEKGAIVVVQQRIHKDDATGHFLPQGNWDHVCLPAEYEPDHPHVWDGDWRTEAGQLLWPEHYGENALADLKLMMAPAERPGQLQQNPTEIEGGMFKRGWWKRWATDRVWEDQLQYEGLEVVQSWDFRFKDSKTSGDYVVGQLWGFYGADAYLLAQVRGRWSFTESQDAMRALTAYAAADRFAPFRRGSAKLVEEKANGAAIINTMRREVGSIIAVNPKESKEARAAAVTARVEGGNVYLPGGDVIPCPPPFVNAQGETLEFEPTPVADFIEEHAGFPLGSHDDQVDALSQVLAWRQPSAPPSPPEPEASRGGVRPLAAGITRRKI